MSREFKCLICCRMFMAKSESHHAVCPECSGETDVRKVDDNLPSPALKTVILSRAEYDRLLAIESEYQRIRKDYFGLVENIGTGLLCMDRIRAAIARTKGEGK